MSWCQDPKIGGPKSKVVLRAPTTIKEMVIMDKRHVRLVTGLFLTIENMVKTLKLP